MAKSIKLVLALAILGGVGACAQQEEVVFIEEPIVVETPTTKF